MTIEMWKELSRELLCKTRVFELHAKRLRSPRDGYVDDFYFLTAPDWVNVVAITSDEQIVLVEQYRHGIHASSLELPGGIANDAKLQENALRELREETGFASSLVTDLGWVHPNPALLNNRCHYYLARNVEKVSEQSLDPAEDIHVCLVPLVSIPERILKGEITHSLSIAGLFRYFASTAAGSISPA